MPRKARPRRGWNPPGLSGSDALTQGERAALSKIARDLKPPESRSVGLADELANVAIIYRLMRQQDAKAPELPVEPTEPPLPKHAYIRIEEGERERSGERAWLAMKGREILNTFHGTHARQKARDWVGTKFNASPAQEIEVGAPQAPPTAEQRRALEHLRKHLSRAWEAFLSLDAASREVLDQAYRSAHFDGTDPKRPRYPLAEPGLLEDDQNALDRMVDRAAVALHLLPPAGGARPLHSLRWVVRELATIHTGITGDSFSVGRERDTVDTLNAPAHWVARVVKIIDPDVTDANLRTAFRQDFNTLQIPTPSQGG